MGFITIPDEKNKLTWIYNTDEIVSVFVKELEKDSKKGVALIRIQLKTGDGYMVFYDDDKVCNDEFIRIQKHLNCG